MAQDRNRYGSSQGIRVMPEHALGPMVVLGGGAVAYERGTPEVLTSQLRDACSYPGKPIFL